MRQRHNKDVLMRNVYTNNVLILYFIVLFLVPVLGGCTDNRYASERLFWQAEQKVAQIVNGKKDNLSNDEYERIISAYREVIDNYPLQKYSQKAQSHIIDMLLLQGKYKEAEQEFTAMADNFSSQPEIASQALFARGKIYEYKEDWPRALEEYEQVIAKYPLSPRGLELPIYIMRHYRDKGDQRNVERTYKQAVKNYRDLLKDFEGTDMASRVKEYLALVHLSKGNFKETLKVYDDIIKEDMNSAFAQQALFAKGDLYATKMRDISKAMEVYEGFVRKYPEVRAALAARLRLAELYLNDGRLAKAEELFSAVINDIPGEKNLCLRAHIGLSKVYAQKGYVEKAVKEYELIAKEFPRSQEALTVPFVIVQYYLDKGYNLEARKALRIAINQYKRITEDNVQDEVYRDEAANFLALCYVKENSFDKGIVLLEKLARKYPDNPMYLIKIASVYHNIHDLDKALAIYKKIVSKYPDHSYIVNIARSQIDILEQK